MELTPRERSALRAAAHSLRPVVLIGDNGLTEAVLKEIVIPRLGSPTMTAMIALSASGEQQQELGLTTFYVIAGT